MIFYAYFGYPICLYAISLIKKRGVPKKSAPSAEKYEPPVSFIIAAYNEEKLIKKKIEGTLSQDYPGKKIEIIVASDCSTDRTDEIVKSFAQQGVKLVRPPERKGKENAQKYAVDTASGEIMVFSDVATILKPDGISNIIRNFENTTIGCVSSEDRFVNKDGNVSGEGAYVKYEMFLRSLESKVNSLVSLSGSFFAARKAVCQNWAPDIQSDFNTVLNAVKLGLRGVSDPKSTGYYKDIADEKKEFDRKVRTVLRGIHVLMRNAYLLNPLKYGLFAWQLFSHKLCRWLVPFFMLTAFLSNAALFLSSGVFFVLFLLQLGFYLLAFYHYKQGKALDSAARNSTRDTKTNNYSFNAIAKLVYYFVSVNLSILTAWQRFSKGQEVTFWEPSTRD